MHRIKIVHVTQSLGGVKTYLEHLLNFADTNSFEFIIIAPLHTEFQNFCKENAITYYPVTAQRNVNIFKDVKSFLRIISILKSEKPDILHTHSAKGGFVGRIAGKILGIKVIYSPHAFSFLSFTGVKRMAFYLLEYLTKPLTNVLLAVSESESGRAIHEVGYEPENVKVVLNSIPVNATLPFRTYADCHHIGMIGRLTEQKNPLLFLEVARRLLASFPYLTFSILGAGLTDNLSGEINRFIEVNQMSEKVHILNWGDNQTTVDFLSRTDIFMLTSVFEGLPYSLLEAMSYGIPCVASKGDGNTDVIQNSENGFACLGVEDFTERVCMLVRDGNLRRRVGQAGSHYVKQKHNIKQNVKQLEAIYSSVFDKNKVIPIKRYKNSVSSDPSYRKVSPGM